MCSCLDLKRFRIKIQKVIWRKKIIPLQDRNALHCKRILRFGKGHSRKIFVAFSEYKYELYAKIYFLCRPNRPMILLSRFPVIAANIFARLINQIYIKNKTEEAFSLKGCTSIAK